jgi:hypothetical protein
VPGQCRKELGSSGVFGDMLYMMEKIVRAASYKPSYEWCSVEPV